MRWIGAGLAAALLSSTAFAQSTGFAPNGNYAAPLSVSVASATVALPQGATVVAYNTGATAAFCTLGNSSVVATTAHNQVAPGGFLAFVVGQNSNIACITATGTTTINVAGGAGNAAGSGGGGGGGGGGGAVTLAPGSVSAGAYVAGALVDCAINTLGCQADAPAATDTSTATLIALFKRSLQLLDSSIPAGTNLIGNAGLSYPAGAVPVEASTTGTTAATAATLPASALVKTYVCAISIRANATAAATGNATLTGPTNTLNFTQWTAPAASGLGINEQIFVPCKPSAAINTAMVLTSAAAGTGGVVSVSAWGYQAP